MQGIYSERSRIQAKGTALHWREATRLSHQEKTLFILSRRHATSWSVFFYATLPSHADILAPDKVELALDTHFCKPQVQYADEEVFSLLMDKKPGSEVHMSHLNIVRAPAWKKSPLYGGCFRF
jgi:hypothetical protein